MWGAWLSFHGIPHSTANRAQRYAKNPKKYREEKANEALAKREKRAGISRSDHGWFMLQALEQADNDALEMVYDLIVNSAKLQGLKKAMQEKAEQKAKRLETLAENKKKREAAAKAKAEEKRAAKAAALTAPTMAPQDSAPAAPV